MTDKKEFLIKFLQDKHVPVFVIGLTNELKKKAGQREYDRSVAFLEKLANESGGRAFFPATALDLSNNIAELLERLRKD